MLAAFVCTSLRPSSPNVPGIVLDRPGNKSYGQTPGAGAGDPRRQYGNIRNGAHHQDNEPAPQSFALTPGHGGAGASPSPTLKSRKSAQPTPQNLPKQYNRTRTGQRPHASLEQHGPYEPMAGCNGLVAIPGDLLSCPVVQAPMLRLPHKRVPTVRDLQGFDVPQ